MDLAWAELCLQDRVSKYLVEKEAEREEKAALATLANERRDQKVR